MPQFDLSTAPSQIFWLVVIFLAFFLVMWRLVLPGMTSVMESRAKKIEADLSRAERLKNEAETVLAEYEKALTDARAKAAEALRVASEAALAQAAKRTAVMAAELAARTKVAQERIEKAAASARASLGTVAGETAALAGEKLLGQALDRAKVDAAVAKVLGS